MDPTTELASNFTVARYSELRPRLTGAAPDNEAWREVIGAMRRRIQERFLTPIQELARYDEQAALPFRPGFAILALDCLLIDTIQSFREGRVSTGDVSSARSFKNFLRAPSFSDFKDKDRDAFFKYVRNAILHNGETRKNWKIRIDTDRMLERGPATDTRTINRQHFHAAIEQEFKDFFALLESGEAKAREQFLRRMDAMAGLSSDAFQYYFAYGSNLREAECRRTAPEAQAHGVAFLPSYRLAFTKHSDCRRGDAATIKGDPSSMVWGYVYRVHDDDRTRLKERERGYEEIPRITVYLLSPNPKGNPKELTAFTFAATNECPQRCGPPAAYLDLIITGAEERNLPLAYRQPLVRLRETLL
ncbi:MAG TPA: gamma-glutamylcyclotransferase family protein [Bryobacteraceae bacterium]